MSSESIDYAAVLADLEKKRSDLDAAINFVRGLLKLKPLEAASSQASAATAESESLPTEVKFDTFFGMSAPEAIKKYLGMMKRPQASTDIAKALSDGGLPTTSDNIGKVIGPTLSRMKTAGDLMLVKGKWALSSWYSAGARERVEAVEKAKGKKKPGRKPVAKKAPAIKPKTEPKAAAPSSEQIEQMKVLQAQGKRPGEIAKVVGVHHFVVMRVLKTQQQSTGTEPDAKVQA